MNPDLCMYSELIWWLGAKPAPGHHLDTWAMQEVWVKGNLGLNVWSKASLGLSQYHVPRYLNNMITKIHMINYIMI